MVERKMGKKEMRKKREEYEEEGIEKQQEKVKEVTIAKEQIKLVETRELATMIELREIERGEGWRWQNIADIFVSIQQTSLLRATPPPTDRPTDRRGVAASSPGFLSPDHPAT